MSEPWTAIRDRWSIESAGHTFVEAEPFSERLICERCDYRTTYATTRAITPMIPDCTRPKDADQ